MVNNLWIVVFQPIRYNNKNLCSVTIQPFRCMHTNCKNKQNFVQKVSWKSFVFTTTKCEWLNRIFLSHFYNSSIQGSMHIRMSIRKSTYTTCTSKIRSERKQATYVVDCDRHFTIDFGRSWKESHVRFSSVYGLLAISTRNSFYSLRVTLHTESCSHVLSV